MIVSRPVSCVVKYFSLIFCDIHSGSCYPVLYRPAPDYFEQSVLQVQLFGLRLPVELSFTAYLQPFARLQKFQGFLFEYFLFLFEYFLLLIHFILDFHYPLCYNSIMFDSRANFGTEALFIFDLRFPICDCSAPFANINTLFRSPLWSEKTTAKPLSIQSLSFSRSGNKKMAQPNIRFNGDWNFLWRPGRNDLLVSNPELNCPIAITNLNFHLYYRQLVRICQGENVENVIFFAICHKLRFQRDLHVPIFLVLFMLWVRDQIG